MIAAEIAFGLVNTVGVWAVGKQLNRSVDKLTEKDEAEDKGGKKK